MMQEEKIRHTESTEALQNLSSNDLTDLVSTDTPDKEVLEVMNGVMTMLSMPTGWKAI